MYSYDSLDSLNAACALSLFWYTKKWTQAAKKKKNTHTQSSMSVSVHVIFLRADGLPFFFFLERMGNKHERTI